MDPFGLRDALHCLLAIGLGVFGFISDIVVALEFKKDKEANKWWFGLTLGRLLFEIPIFPMVKRYLQFFGV